MDSEKLKIPIHFKNNVFSNAVGMVGGREYIEPHLSQLCSFNIASYCWIGGVYYAVCNIGSGSCLLVELLLLLAVLFYRLADALFEFKATFDLSRQLNSVSYQLLIGGFIVEQGVFQSLA